MKTILPDWKGNPVKDGKFIDPNTRFTGTFTRFLRWQFTRNDKRTEKKNEQWRLKVRQGNSFLKNENNCLVWLGHASFYLQLNGVKILIDPIFGRISGIVPRYSEMPCPVEDFVGIDYILLSHGHRDHADKATLQKLCAQNNLTLLTGLNNGKMVADWVDGLKFQEAGWYQQFDLKNDNLRITYLPTQHWSNRYLWDLNQTLWGCFMIEYNGLTIYFGGDSGYCSYPKQAGGLFPNIDIAMIGVGAYYPQFMMKDVHTSPHDAIKAFHDLGAKTLIPMHYGTFDLADEPLGEPYRILKYLEEHNEINGDLKLLDVGQVLEL
ncbi:MAG TPA: MBL fold metallo-hydrolase [Chitinophagales bacterium]|nr:MBL fold metallo-hydrolase [Chitinophagales bacterium]